MSFNVRCAYDCSVEGVVDKDLTALLLAQSLNADGLIMLVCGLLFLCRAGLTFVFRPMSTRFTRTLAIPIRSAFVQSVQLNCASPISLLALWDPRSQLHGSCLDIILHSSQVEAACQFAEGHPERWAAIGALDDLKRIVQGQQDSLLPLLMSLVRAGEAGTRVSSSVSSAVYF